MDLELLQLLWAASLLLNTSTHCLRSLWRKHDVPLPGTQTAAANK